MTQEPAAGARLLRWVGDILEVKVARSEKRRTAGRMVFRTNLGSAAIRQAEVLAHVDESRLISGDDWHDIPMEPCGRRQWRVRIPLLEVGVFEGKACFLPDGDPIPEWPEGPNTVIKVAPARTAAGNMIYAAFTRQFGRNMAASEAPRTHAREEALLDRAGYTVIPPSGTFRSLIRHLDHICGGLGFRNLLLLPIHPTPTTFARMGRYGSPFAGLDFLSVDPALAEFDTKATPLDQFHELVGAVHARGASLFMDLPANHTGWAATFQIHHPEWYKRNADGSFHSPGAWGVTWEDLVELDYARSELRRAIADVFLYWCRQGVDGFRCDAGYMIPKAAWDVIVALVRREYPDTVFLLEGLGGPMETTAALIGASGLDWAYSELFQTYDRRAFEAMLPGMLALSESRGPLVHFAETHDNNRLAATSHAYARMRIALSALLSQQGAFGITAGVEWLAREKIDVHGCGGLNWGAEDNACALIRRLNALLRCHPLFGPGTSLAQIQHGGGNVLAVVRRRPAHAPLLVLANLDWEHPQTVAFQGDAFPGEQAYDLLSGETVPLSPEGMPLGPGQVRCLSTRAEDLSQIEATCCQRGQAPVAEMSLRQRRVMALRTLLSLGESPDLDGDLQALANRFIQDPVAFTADPASGMPRAIRMRLPADLRREICVPPGFLLCVTGPYPFRAVLSDATGAALSVGVAIALGDGGYGLMLSPRRRTDPVATPRRHTERLSLSVELYAPEGVLRRSATVHALGNGETAGRVRRRFSGLEVRDLGNARALLTNGAGAMAQMRLKWGDIRSQYDCLLALNRHPAVPTDRQVFLTRCRAWILCNGFSTPLAGPCLEHVTVAPDGSAAMWRFAAPCGMGRRVPIVLRVALEPGGNRVVLRFRREKASGPWHDPAVSVGLVLRPDIEWRNFHSKTKAYAGPERDFPAAVTHRPDGFDFAPEPNVRLAVTLPGADWRQEAEWTYNVPHPEEAARGQEGTGDLWSPGWFHIELERGQEAVLTAGEAAPKAPRIPAFSKALPSASLPLREAMCQAMRNYIVRRDAHKTVIAGYPWFLDWGRDTLIFLRGVAAAGDWETVFDTLTEFGRFEKEGTLPNMIRGEDDANRETVDAPLWFAVVCDDAIAALGADRVLNHPCGNRTLRDVLVSIAEHYLKGTVNGIRVDAATGLVWAPAHYTWMDTNYPAGTPRQGYAVEVQALWVRLLDLLGREVSPKWGRLASRVRRAFRELFPLPEGGLSDCLHAGPGISARRADPDDAIRPNQLYAVTLGLLRDDKALAASVLSATECLLLPGAIRTLADRPVRRALPIVRDGKLLNDPAKPYWGRYEGDEDTRRKPAYHNGTGWTLPFPLYAEALLLVYGEAARAPAQAWLASSELLINRDTVTQLPECVQGDAPHEPCGTGAQAWGISELLRVLTLAESALEAGD